EAEHKHERAQTTAPNLVVDPFFLSRATAASAISHADSPALMISRFRAAATPSRLKQVLQAELHLSGYRISRARDTSERRRTEVSVRRLEIGPIGDVIYLDADLEILRPALAERLAERQVHAPLRRAVHRADADIARRELWLKCKGRCVEPALERALAGRQVGIADQVGSIAAADVGLRRRVDDRERDSGRVVGDEIDLPAREEPVRDAVESLPQWQLI